ncbi:hypothetical protein CEP51_000906 [Fusarium floridanum]|uniref:Uncharacterized protein n=1 Tax=Fusarium floridanum TaxID=1325733 RepID=A0A428SJS2_9HYPO|nr:hypothetical protein CEP51_000906 [Fusarium floridanum]
MVSKALFFHILFALIFPDRVKKAKQTMDYASGIRLTDFVLYIILPFLVIEVSGFVHFVLLMLVFRAYYRMDPVAEPSPQYAGAPLADDAHPSLPQDQDAPPSYEERESGHLIGKSTKAQPQDVEMPRMTTLPE